MPLSAKGCLSPGPRGKHHILAECGPDYHRQMSSATRSGRVLSLRLVQKAAAAAIPKLKQMPAACQLTAFTRQNGKSHGPCSNPETFRSNTQLSRHPQRLPQPCPADPQPSPRTCVLDRRPGTTSLLVTDYLVSSCTASLARFGPSYLSGEVQSHL